jgi:DNA-binding NarL/FixJ family response regulator
VNRIYAKKRISKHYLFHFFPGPLRNRIPIPEVLMSFTVILALGLDSLVAAQRSVWQSAGYFVTPIKSISEAIVHLREGDFDLVLLGHSIPTDSRERFTFLIRESGSRTPVVSITDSSTERDSFADATIRNDPASLLKSIRELMAERARAPAPSRNMPAIAT